MDFRLEMGKKKSVDIDLPYLVELFKPRHTIVRVAWIIVFLAMIVLGVYLIILLIQDYLEYSSFNLISVLNVKNFTLPAITICNLSPMNATAVKENNPGLLELYYSLASAYKKLNGSSDTDFTSLNNQRMFQNMNYVMKPGRTLVYSETSFGKSGLSVDQQNTISNSEFTEMGYCFEVNDDAMLVQEVEGQEGGLVMVLDANVDHYLSNVESEGFYITLRMPNETIVNKGFGFTVAPGEEVLVDIEKLEVERLGTPWGNCKDETDLFNSAEGEIGDTLTHRECFLLHKLWLYFSDSACRCYPWYFFERYLSQGKARYDSKIADRLERYLMHTLDNDTRLTFNKTCRIKTGNSSNVYYGERIKTIDNVANYSVCSTLCRSEVNCLLFAFAQKDNDYMLSKQCMLYTENTHLQEVDSSKNVHGMLLGRNNCTATGGVSECTLSQGLACEDSTMRKVMSQNEKYKRFSCSETCEYQEYRHTLSRSRYPSRKYWDTTLSKTNANRFEGTDDKKFEQAQQNLVKLVFFTRRMRKTSVIQTATYEFQSLVAEFGGITDLFIGISFFTLFQFLDIAITKCFGSKKKNTNKKEDVTLENIH